VTNKYVDGDFLRSLLAGSFEAMISNVDQVATESADLFRSEGEEDVRVLGTYPNHLIVANSAGEFFKAEYSVEGDEMKLGQVKRIDVPVKEASELSQDARRVSEAVVDAMFSGEDGVAIQGIEELHSLVSRGVKLTMDSVMEGVVRATSDDNAWVRECSANESDMRKLAGSAAHANLIAPRFESIEESNETVDRVIMSSAKKLAGFCEEVSNRIAVAQASIDGGIDLDTAALSEYVQLVASLSESLSEILGCLSDGLAISEGTDCIGLARVHDAVAAKVYELNLSSAFVEGVALKFAPSKVA